MREKEENMIIDKECLQAQNLYIPALDQAPGTRKHQRTMAPQKHPVASWLRHESMMDGDPGR